MIQNDNEIYMGFKVRTPKKEGNASLYIRVKFNGMDNTINTGINIDLSKWYKRGSQFFETMDGIQAKAQALKVQRLLKGMKAQGVSNIEVVKEQVTVIAKQQDEEDLERIRKEVEVIALKSVIGYYKRFYLEISTGERTHGNSFKELVGGIKKPPKI